MLAMGYIPIKMYLASAMAYIICESYEPLKTLCQIWFFGHIFFVWAFLDLQFWDRIDHKGIYMWEKFHIIWIYIERNPSI